MGQTALSAIGGERKWKSREAFVAQLSAYRTERFPKMGKKPARDGGILTFMDQQGKTFERNSTTLWDRLILGDKARKQGPVLKVGEIVRVKAGDKEKGEFLEFEINRLEGTSIPTIFKRGK